MRSIAGIEASLSKIRIQVIRGIFGLGIANRAVDVALTIIVVALIAKSAPAHAELRFYKRIASRGGRVQLIVFSGAVKE